MGRDRRRVDTVHATATSDDSGPSSTDSGSSVTRGRDGVCLGPGGWLWWAEGPLSVTFDTVCARGRSRGCAYTHSQAPPQVGVQGPRLQVLPLSTDRQILVRACACACVCARFNHEQASVAMGCGYADACLCVRPYCTVYGEMGDALILARALHPFDNPTAYCAPLPRPHNREFRGPI